MLGGRRGRGRREGGSERPGAEHSRATAARCHPTWRPKPEEEVCGDVWSRVHLRSAWPLTDILTPDETQGQNINHKSQLQTEGEAHLNLTLNASSGPFEAFSTLQRLSKSSVREEICLTGGDFIRKRWNQKTWTDQ